MTDGSNDPPITADKIDSDPGGDLTGDLSDDKGYLVYNYAAEHVPQPRLAGPAAQLSQYPLPASDLDYIDPLTVDSNGNLAVELGNGLTLDSNGRISVPAGAITEEMLGFATATDSELSSHANDSTNPHSVTDEQIGPVGSSAHGDGVSVPSYSDLASVPPLSNGEIVFVESENAFYMEDGT